MPPEAETLIALLYVVTAVCVSSIGIPQTISLFRRRRQQDGLQLFRVLWVLIMAALCVLAISRAALWLDIRLFDQAWLGTIAVRWRMEAAIAAIVAVSSVYSAALYWRTRAEARP